MLTWDNAPADLDTHLTGPTTSGPRFHVAYYALTVNDGSVASLDVDDTSSYGPETVTITSQIAGVYRYYVHDFTNDGTNPSLAMSNSGAQVKVYNSSGLVATFNIPANQGGTIWEDIQTQRIYPDADQPVQLRRFDQPAVDGLF